MNPVTHISPVSDADVPRLAGRQLSLTSAGTSRARRPRGRQAVPGGTGAGPGRGCWSVSPAGGGASGGGLIATSLGAPASGSGPSTWARPCPGGVMTVTKHGDYIM